MRLRLAVPSVALAVAATVGLAPARTTGSGPAPVRLVESYRPPAGDHAGDVVRGRAWTYDSAVEAAGLAAAGELDRAGALLDALQAVQREDGALESSYQLDGNGGAGPLRSGVQAWVGLAALEWRAVTCSGRHDALIAGVARWLLSQRITERHALGYGLFRGGPDIASSSTEHNLEARGFFAGLGAALDGRPVDPVTGRACSPGLDGLSYTAARSLSAEVHEVVEALDRAIDARLIVRDGAGWHVGQGLGDDARPIDVQALGILWLLGRDRRAHAEAVARAADETMLVHDRRVEWPGAGQQLFSGYRPFAEDWGPDVLWIEGTIQMRLAKARLGDDVAALDDTIARWKALSAPEPPLQVDRAAGEDYHVWPAAAPAAWERLARSGFSLLG